MIKSPAFLLCVAFLALQLPASQALAQGTQAEPPPPALVRAWILPAQDTQAFTLTAKSPDGEQVSTLAATKGAARQTSAGYNEVKAGPVVVEVKAGDSVLASGSLPLIGGAAYTVIGWNTGAKWELRAFQDSAKSPGAADRPLRAVNFADGREVVLVLNGKEQSKLPGNSVQEIRLKPEVFDIGVKVLTPDGGPPFQTATAFDLTQADSAYLLIAPDYRGRPDVAVISGGVTPEPAGPAGAALAAPAPPSPEELRKQQAGLRNLELSYRQAQLKALEESEKGPNKIPNAAEIRRQLEQEIKNLQKPPAPTPAAPVSP